MTPEPYMRANILPWQLWAGMVVFTQPHIIYHGRDQERQFEKSLPNLSVYHGSCDTAADEPITTYARYITLTPKRRFSFPPTFCPTKLYFTSFIHSYTFWQCIINKVLGRITLFINNWTLSVPCTDRIVNTYQRRCHYNAFIFFNAPTHDSH